MAKIISKIGINISIHAPRVGSDESSEKPATKIFISIHAPRVGSDDINLYIYVVLKTFQSTLPVWGAT